jgi:hypothetical protein
MKNITHAVAALLGVTRAGYILAAAAAFVLSALPSAASVMPVAVVLEGSHPPDVDRHQGSFNAPQPLCPSGTWQGNGRGERVFSCADGSGSFTARFDGEQEHRTGGSAPWWITAGTDRYANLRGRGTASNVLHESDPITFTNTWNGVVDFDSVAPSVVVLSASATRFRTSKSTFNLRVSFRAADDVAGNAVDFDLTVWTRDSGQIATRRGTQTGGTSLLTLKIRVPSRLRSVQLQIDATDPVGNTRTTRRNVMLPSRSTARAEASHESRGERAR